MYPEDHFKGGFSNFEFVIENGLLVLRKSLKMGSGNEMDHFEKEVKSLEKLADVPYTPNLVRYDLDCDIPYIDYEPFLGINFLNFISAVKNPLEHIGLVKKTVSVVGYLHSYGFVHRDLNPRNIFLGLTFSEYNPIITDFGLALHSDIVDGHEKPAGTPCCASPEQIRTISLGPRSDIYSLGVLMYKLFTKRFPFQGKKQDVLVAHLCRVPRLPWDIDTNIPWGLSQIVMKCLEKRPKDRYQTCSELHDALDAYEKSL